MHLISSVEVGLFDINITWNGNEVAGIKCCHGNMENAKYSIDQQADSSFMVTYLPVEVGLFDFNVTWNGNEIAGMC